MAALISTVQVAERLGVSASAVRKWALEREIPCIDLGSVYRFDPDEIEAWINERKRSTGQGLGGQTNNRGVAGDMKKATAPTVTSKTRRS